MPAHTRTHKHDHTGALPGPKAHMPSHIHTHIYTQHSHTNGLAHPPNPPGTHTCVYWLIRASMQEGPSCYTHTHTHTHRGALAEGRMATHTLTPVTQSLACSHTHTYQHMNSRTRVYQFSQHSHINVLILSKFTHATLHRDRQAGRQTDRQTDRQRHKTQADPLSQAPHSSLDLLRQAKEVGGGWVPRRLLPSRGRG